METFYLFWNDLYINHLQTAGYVCKKLHSSISGMVAGRKREGVIADLVF